MDISIVNQVFDTRKDFYKKSKVTDDVGHVFTSIINNKNSFEFADEKVILYMIFQNFQSALNKLRTRNFNYAEYFIQKAEKLMENLVSDNAQMAIKGISLPLYAFKYYIKKDYDEAQKALEESFGVFEQLAAIEVKDAVWAKREQYLNLIRIKMNQQKYEEAFSITQSIVTDFLGTAPLNADATVDSNEKTYLRSLSEFDRYDGMHGLMDSILFKINVIEDKEVKQKLYNDFFKALLEADGYNYLNKSLEYYLSDDKKLMEAFIDVCNTDYVLPRSMEGLLLKKIIANIDNSEIEKIITNYSTEVLKITFG